MKIQNPKLQQMLAAEYVLGTLTGPARKRFERLATGNAALLSEIRYWEQRLAGLSAGLTPETPREIVWTEIDRRINAVTPAATAAVAAPVRPRERFNLWRAWAIAATISSVYLGYALQQQLAAGPQIIEIPKIVKVKVPVPQPMPYVAVLQLKGDVQLQLTLSPERGLIRAAMTGAAPVDLTKHSVQLWVFDTSGTPRSLGVMPESGAGEMPMPKGVAMPEKPTLALSLEPFGGAPGPLPTGPVLTTATAFKAL